MSANASPGWKISGAWSVARLAVPMFNNALFLLQIAVILAVSRVSGAVFRRLGQPQVAGEMAAGIALGPTLFGWLAPGAFAFLFPPDSLGFLNALSQAGLVIFLFLVGVRVDFAELRRQTGIALVTSQVSIAVPLLTGIALAQYLYPRYGGGSPLAFALFVGTAMSVTAFPVLARILIERDLLRTRLGSIAIAAAAIGDIAAWILLAAIVALTRHDQTARPFWMTLVALAIFIAVLLALGRALHAWSARVPLPVFIVLALAAGAAGDWIGIHALAGAFIAGLVTPRQFRQQLIDTFEPVTLLMLAPLFFALTGIRTNLAFHESGAYLDLLLILFAAIASKWGGAMIAARAKGMTWAEACQLGLLMNTRGLVELIVLNVGLDAGILSPALFSMMVSMALVTTIMATPLMDWAGGAARRRNTNALA